MHLVGFNAEGISDNHGIDKPEMCGVKACICLCDDSGCKNDKLVDCPYYGRFDHITTIVAHDDLDNNKDKPSLHLYGKISEWGGLSRDYWDVKTLFVKADKSVKTLYFHHKPFVE